MNQDDERRPKPSAHEIGQDLSLLSVADCEDRIALLDGEIARLREAMARKSASRDAAAAFFKT